jgi:hypothetical protein
MKKISVLLTSLIISLAATAQAENGTATFGKSVESALLYDMPYPEEAVINGIEKKMNTWGKPKKARGFTMYRNVTVSGISSQPITLYFRVEKKSKKDNNSAVLTMMMANEFDRFYKLEDSGEMFAKAKEFLNDFAEPVAAANLELQITAQDDVVKKEDKSLKKLKDDSIDYEKQKKKLEDKIAQNAKDIEQQEKAVAAQKEQLDILVKQRKN